LLGIQRHKQGAAMLRALLAPGDQAAITPLPEHASWSAAELAVACPELASQLRPVADPVAGLAWLHLRLGPEPGAGELASPEEGGSGETGAALPVVAGSLYLLGALIPWLDPAAAGPG
jgi:dihydrofolate synthase/folylpolyglutamate synthase